MCFSKHNLNQKSSFHATFCVCHCKQGLKSKSSIFVKTLSFYPVSLLEQSTGVLFYFQICGFCFELSVASFCITKISIRAVFQSFRGIQYSNDLSHLAFFVLARSAPNTHCHMSITVRDWSCLVMLSYSSRDVLIIFFNKCVKLF